MRPVVDLPSHTRRVMVDKHGRAMRKLRLSLLDACNLRCQYCMPENPTFLPRKDWAGVEDIVRITRTLLELGIEEVRLTGGEPTLRADLPEILAGLAELSIPKFGITSNGLLVEPLLPQLLEAGCTHLNISLDSLTPEGFRAITRRDGFERVMRTVLAAKDMGFHVKINAVIMRGLNDHEVVDFATWSADTGLEVRFLEVMNIGIMKAQFDQRFVPASEMETQLKTHWNMTPIDVAPDSTAYKFRLENGAVIGFIASQSKPFCMGCSRLRLSPKGHIRPCLFREDGIDLKGKTLLEVEEILQKVMALKPTGRIDHVPQPMYQIGG